jgi:phenylacetate-CoA ligase
MFVHPSQVAEVLKRHPEVQRARLVVEGEMANDRMTLHVESTEHASALCDAVASSVREVTKLRADIVWAAPGSLPNDGKVIEDKRSYS